MNDLKIASNENLGNTFSSFRRSEGILLTLFKVF